jgi:hypothetical protein
MSANDKPAAPNYKFWPVASQPANLCLIATEAIDEEVLRRLIKILCISSVCCLLKNVS